MPTIFLINIVVTDEVRTNRVSKHKLDNAILVLLRLNLD